MDDTQAKAFAKLKEVYEDKYAEVNNHKYVFLKTTHCKRRKVFAYYSSIGHYLQGNNPNFAFMGSKEFEEIENIISQIVSYEDETLSKRKDHWNEFPEDYIPFITVAMGVISYPFLSGSHTG